MQKQLSRRAALAGLALAPAAAPMAAPAIDAELLALEPRFLAAVAAYEQVCDGDEPDELDVDGALDAAYDIADQICDLPASTLAGLRVKARVLAWIQPASMTCGPDQPQLYDELVTSLIGDLMGEASEAAS